MCTHCAVQLAADLGRSEALSEEMTDRKTADVSDAFQPEALRLGDVLSQREIEDWVNELTDEQVSC